MTYTYVSALIDVQGLQKGAQDNQTTTSYLNMDPKVLRGGESVLKPAPPQESAPVPRSKPSKSALSERTSGTGNDSSDYQFTNFSRMLDDMILSCEVSKRVGSLSRSNRSFSEQIHESSVPIPVLPSPQECSPFPRPIQRVKSSTFRDRFFSNDDHTIGRVRCINCRFVFIRNTLEDEEAEGRFCSKDCSVSHGLMSQGIDYAEEAPVSSIRIS